MKKVMSVLISVMSLLCFAFGFVGCRGGNSGESGEVDAWIYSIQSAYEMGLLDEDDLKSIACRQYECYKKEENPYTGLFTQQTEISAKAEKDFKKVFCERYNKISGNKEAMESNDVEIVNYYGTYEGNVVADVNNNYEFNSRKHIGGVEFSNDADRIIYVLHYTEYASESATVTGMLYNVETAYERGWLNENDLKSLACYFYGVDSEENPYSGMYIKPEDKLSKEMKSELKYAYLRQIAGTWSTCLDDASITKYYGTYNGNIVVSMEWNAGCIYPNLSVEPDKEIGGVIFKDYSWMAFYVYHFFVDGV